MICRRIFIFITICLLSTSDLWAQHPLWHSNTARTIEKGSWEVKLLHPWRYGIRRDIEISSSPITFYKIPNLSVKKAFRLDKIKLSTKHSLNYYTPVLNYLRDQKDVSFFQGIGSFKNIVGLKNELLFSKYLFDNRYGKFANIFTARLAIQVTSSHNLVYNPGPENTVYFLFNEVTYFPVFGELGGQLDGKITDYLNYSTRLDVSYFGKGWNGAIGNEGWIIWYKNQKTKKINRIHIALGYKFYYRFKEKGHDLRFYPGIDIIYRFQNRFDASKELFIEELKYF